MNENPVILEQIRIQPGTSDLSQRRQADVLVCCWALDHEYQQKGVGYGFRQALEYLGGLDQKKHEKDTALRYIETVRGRPEFTDLLHATVTMQNQILYMRHTQEAQERRQRGPIVEDAAKSKRDLESKNPNLTKSYAKSPNRLRLVKTQR
ncbi:MAG: hypothetical protein ACYCS8_18135 [Acidithiobacillus sp.]